MGWLFKSAEEKETERQRVIQEQEQLLQKKRTQFLPYCEWLNAAATYFGNEIANLEIQPT